MKIAWFTPFEKNSAIGRYSIHATRALSKYMDIDLFAEKKDSMLLADVHTEFFDDDEDMTARLAPYDYIVYNMGNYLPFHKGIYDVMQKHPGIVIAHDLSMHDFFHSYYFDADMEDEYEDIIEKIYGKDVREEIELSKSNFGHINNIDVLKYHMLELLARNAQGFIVHSHYHAKKLKRIYSGEVAVLPLIEMTEFDTDTEATGGQPVYDKNKLNLLSVGVVNRNKLASEVMQAIASSKYLRKNATYTIIGETSDEIYLRKLLRLLKREKLDKIVRILGYQDFDVLKRYYNDADIICNLRYPAYEGGSATLQEQLLLGKTTMVVDTGVYSEVPDDCVVKIDAGHFKQSLAARITELAEDREYCAKIGRNAKAYAKEEYAKERYAKLFMEYMEKMMFLKPLYSVMDTTKAQMAALGFAVRGAEADLGIMEYTAQEFEKLFGGACV